MKKSGFTLIELLVVISIIGVLSAVVISALNSARLKARNVERISNLRQVQKALEMYFNDNGVYPPKPGLGTYSSECPGTGDVVGWGPYSATSSANSVIPGLIPNYIAKLPTDPTMTIAFDQGGGVFRDRSCYMYWSNGKDYAYFLHTILDPGFDYYSFPAFIDPLRDGVNDSSGCTFTVSGNPWAWKVFSTGGRCM